ncbi:MAG: putative PurR-regulated permease PerM [Saprospiraceae bacterium]|jgi:predicted PurR-regulated permease PerM
MYADTSIKNVAYSIFIILSLGYVSYIGSTIILPLLFASIFSIFLYPINRRISRFIKSDIISIAISFLIVILPISIIGSLFIFQLLYIIDELPSISQSLKDGSAQAILWFQSFIPGLDLDSKNILKDMIGTSIDGPLKVVGKSVITSTSMILSTFLTFIYAFFILYYRRSIKNFIIYQFEKRFRSDIQATFIKIKLVVQSYIGGLFIVIAVLSVVNSLGLWIIGVDYPMFWGTLAGFLAVIPYIGTGLGGLLPFLYSLATCDTAWQPVAIVIFYGFVQTIEGNVLTPKIVGDKVNINPLVAILSLVIFGSLWGVGGVVLALPLISITRIILLQFESTKSIAVLMSSDIVDRADKFKKIAMVKAD